MKESALIGLGSSLGPRLAYLRLAVAALSASSEVRVLSRSRVYCSSPVGAATNSFLNSVVRIETSLGPFDLLCLCQRIEKRLGRQVSGRWMDRVIDLDVLLYGDVAYDSDALTIPHPGILQRPFVYVPAKEVAGDMMHPELGQKMSEYVAQEPASLILWGCL